MLLSYFVRRRAAARAVAVRRQQIRELKNFLHETYGLSCGWHEVLDAARERGIDATIEEVASVFYRDSKPLGRQGMLSRRGL